MTKDQIGGIARTGIAAGIGYAVGKGLIPAADYSDLIGALSTALVAAWSMWTNRPDNIAPKM